MKVLWIVGCVAAAVAVWLYVLLARFRRGLSEKRESERWSAIL